MPGVIHLVKGNLMILEKEIEDIIYVHVYCIGCDGYSKGQ